VEVAVPNVAEIFNAEQEPNGTLLVLFIPSKDKDGNDLKDQDVWASSASSLLSELYGGATNMPPAEGRWYNEETKKIITEPVILIHCYLRERDVNDEAKYKKVAEFLHRMGRQTNQGEVVLVLGDILYRIRKYRLAEKRR
jgi:hypothetical protein